MATAQVKVSADTSQAKKALTDLNKQVGDVDAKGRRVKVGAGVGAGGVSGNNGGIMSSIGNAVGVITAGFASAAGAINLFRMAVDEARAQQEARKQASESLDDWNDRGNALGVSDGRQAVATSMALSQTLKSIGASPRAMERIIGSWAQNQSKLTDSDREQLGIKDLDGAKALIKIFQDFGGYDAQKQDAVAKMLGMDSARMATVFSAMKVGANDKMGATYEGYLGQYMQLLPKDATDATGYAEMARGHAENVKAVLSVQNTNAIRKDADLELQRANRAGNRANGSQSWMQGIMNWGADQVEDGVRGAFGDGALKSIEENGAKTADILFKIYEITGKNVAIEDKQVTIPTAQ